MYRYGLCLGKSCKPPCPMVANPGQEDSDGNGIGDACDTTPPTVSINSSSAPEGDKGKKDLVFNVTLSKPWTQRVTVAYATGNGTASAGSDYKAASGSLSINAGGTSATIKVSVTGDTSVEDDETFTVTLSSPVNAAIGNGTGIGTIENDDIPTADMSISISAPNAKYRAGDQVVYTIVVSNKGPAAAMNVVITDLLPSSLSFVSCTVPSGSCGASGEGGLANIGALPSGSSATISLTARINVGVPPKTKILNTVSVGSTTADPSIKNNTASSTVSTANN